MFWMGYVVGGVAFCLFLYEIQERAILQAAEAPDSILRVELWEWMLVFMTWPVALLIYIVFRMCVKGLILWAEKKS